MSNCIMLVDGPNLHAVEKMFRQSVDYDVLMRLPYSRGSTIIENPRYYTSRLDGDDTIQPLVDQLSESGWNVITRRALAFVGPGGRRIVRGSIDVNVAVDAMLAAEKSTQLETLDEIVLVSGSGSFSPLGEALKQLGISLTVVSTQKTNGTVRTPFIARDLMEAAHEYIDVMDVPGLLKPRPRSQHSRESAQ